jgi:hypothetical protein
MAKTESTAINSLIELTATATPLKPAPGEDLMFAEPAKRSTKSVSVPRMSATLTNAAPVEPLPRGRGAAGTQQNALTPPGVRITTAPPSRAVTIPPMTPPPVPTRSSAGLTPPTSSPPLPPPPRTSRPSLPPPVRPSAAMAAAVTGAPLHTPPPTDPSFDPAPLAPIDLTDQSWFEESRAVDRVTGPVSESTWVGTVQVPKQTSTAQWLGRLALPMGAMIIIGIFVGGYVAFDGQGGHKRAPQAEPVAGVAPATGDLAKAGDLASANAATANAATGDLANTDSVPAKADPATSPVTGDVATAAPAVGNTASENAERAIGNTGAEKAERAIGNTGTEKAERAIATTGAATAAVTPPNLAAATAVPTAAVPAVTTGKTVFVDVRLDSKPSGATVMLVDRGKTMFLGTTPISTALDPSRQYDVVFTYKDRPTVLEHVDPRTQSKVSVTLDRSASRIAKVGAPKAETPKAEAPKAIAKEAPKAETPKAEAPKAEAPKAVAKEVPKAEAPKAGGEGVLMVSSKPPCEIYIDGKATGLMTPQRSLPVSAGTHKVTLINSAEKIKKTLTVQITADQPTKLIQDLMAK